MSLVALGLNAALLASTLPRALAWRRDAGDPARAQRRVLRRLVGANRDAHYGRAHGFAEIESADDFRRRVPLTTAENYEPWVARIVAGEPGVLTTEPVTALLPTSGTTRPARPVPYTAGLLDDFRAGIDPWLAHLGARTPAVIGGTAYWQITPAGRMSEHRATPAVAGFEGDTAYLGKARAALTRRLLTVPESVSEIEDPAEFRRTTLRHLLARRDLALVSIWNPSFLTLLLDALPALAPELLPQLPRRRAAEVDALLSRWSGDPEGRDAAGRTLYERLWPQLALVSCWADAGAADYAERLRRRLPNTSLQPKGLVATEAFVTFPLDAERRALALGAHFFEFLEPDQHRSRLAHELRRGAVYDVVVSTRGGFYRYRLGDRVRVTGWVRGCPCLELVGRNDGVVDLVGEKLSEIPVRAAVAAVFAGRPPDFWLLAPEGDETRHYALFVQGEVAGSVAAALEEELCANPHYRYARALGQLAAVELVRIPSGVDAMSIYLERVAARVGDAKPPGLSRLDGWRERFSTACSRTLEELHHTRI